LGYRDLRASLAQFNLVPVDPEADRQAQIEQFIEESVRLAGLDGFDFASPFPDSAEEWTVVYDKFQVHRR
jgi:hypothetical protein